jgi:hypothetical protein
MEINFIYLIFLFLLIGIIHILLNKKLNEYYMSILIFFLVKMIFNYRKCTISYIECKLRNVKKESGYINNFVNQIIDTRETNKIIFIYIYAFIIIYFNFNFNSGLSL